jgi:hypothetical protein
MPWVFHCEGRDCGRKTNETYKCPKCKKKVGFCCYQFWKSCSECGHDLCEECSKGCEREDMDYELCCDDCYDEFFVCYNCKRLIKDAGTSEEPFVEPVCCCCKDFVCTNNTCLKEIVKGCGCFVCVKCNHDSQNCFFPKEEGKEEMKEKEGEKENEQIKSEKVFPETEYFPTTPEYFPMNPVSGEEEVIEENKKIKFEKEE